MKNITLKQLRYFSVLAECQHFGRAASLLSVTQPALSQQIKLLEDELGFALFERGARGVILLAQGIEFQQKAEEILAKFEDLSTWAQEANGAELSRLKLGLIPTIAPYLLPKIVQTLKRNFAHIELSVRETKTEQIIEDLLSGRLDAAILALPLEHSALVEYPLFDERFLMIKPRSAHFPEVAIHDDLRGFHWLLLEEGHCFRDQALSVCGLEPSPDRQLVDGSSLTTLVQMVEAGMGVTLLPEMAVKVETRGARVDVETIALEGAKRSVGMIWRKSTAHKALFSAIASDLSKLRAVENRH